MGWRAKGMAVRGKLDRCTPAKPSSWLLVASWRLDERSLALSTDKLQQPDGQVADDMGRDQPEQDRWRRITHGEVVWSLKRLPLFAFSGVP